MPLLPIMLRIEGRRCLVVGAGRVSERRVRYLLDAGALVTVVAPQVCANLDRAWDAGLIELRRREYAASDLTGMTVVIAATDSPPVNEQVSMDAHAAGILCCDAETQERGDFVVPSIVRRGDLTLAVSTGGYSPSLASRIAAELELSYGPEYKTYVELLGAVREHAINTLADHDARKTALCRLAQDQTILEMIRDGQVDKARRKAISCISSPSD